MQLKKVSKQLPSKHNSLYHDLVLGWSNKRSISQASPVSISYRNNLDLTLVKQLTKFQSRRPQKVAYIGPQYKSNHQVFKKFCFKEYDRQVNNSYIFTSSKLQKFKYPFFKRRELPSQNYIHNRIFFGINPTLDQKNTLHFDSDFECGNLDAAVKVSQQEYDLFMRPDTNTSGHCYWYLFTVRNTRKNLRVKFNICNFCKPQSLYERDFKPYVLCKSSKEKGWQQGGSNIQYKNQQLRYSFLSKKYNVLHFQFQFQNQYDEVSFSFLPPYSYSQLLAKISQLIETFPCKSSFRQIGLSLGGLPIPILQFSRNNALKKKIIYVSGRIHPGQSQASFIVQGFMQELAKTNRHVQILLQTAVVRVIPMLNPDGVVLGNYRTSLSGKDLNRKFQTQTENANISKYPQICHLCNQVRERVEEGQQIEIFIDVHGHSLKRNAFFYGPDYKINQKYYYECRTLPKLLDSIDQAFRYYACSYRISEKKLSTLRQIAKQGLHAQKILDSFRLYTLGQLLLLL